MPCFGKKLKAVRKHELSFMGMVSDGCDGNAHILDDILKMAKEDGCEDQIFGAHDEDGDLPIHKAANYGHPTALAWVIKTWGEND